MDFSIQIEDVWKSYGAVPAVCGLSLNVPPRSVYGFLGPNGAGKSTTIRIVLGLQRPDRGSVYLFGHALAENRLTLLRRIGSLVESPSLYENLTGRENLEVHRRLLALPIRAIDEALDTVDLLPAADRVVKGYSSGMKQRLGLAQALLGNPELLLLDEPTNGLDPAGIREVRDLIRDLPNRSKATVFLSSHLLAEVEQVATHLAVIWVSLRWRSFSVAIGTGIIATVVGFFTAVTTDLVGGGWPRYFPWSLPMLALANSHPDLNLLLCAGFISGILVAIAGCLDFCRLEVQ